MAKRGKGSREKGKRFEREVAKRLSEWSGLEARRTPMSGGYDKLKFPGDIIISEDFPICFELKNEEGWTLSQLLFSEKCSILKWWEQCRNEAKISGKVPVLIFTKNFHPALVMCTDEITTVLKFKSIEKALVFVDSKTSIKMIATFESFLESFEYVKGRKNN